MADRLCAKVGCGRPAGSTLTYDYADGLVVIGPLAYLTDPHSYDLCDAHAARLTAPKGWSILRHRSASSQPDPPPPSGMMGA